MTFLVINVWVTGDSIVLKGLRGEASDYFTVYSISPFYITYLIVSF